MDSGLFGFTEGDQERVNEPEFLSSSMGNYSRPPPLDSRTNVKPITDERARASLFTPDDRHRPPGVLRLETRMSAITCPRQRRAGDACNDLVSPRLVGKQHEDIAWTSAAARSFHLSRAVVMTT